MATRRDAACVTDAAAFLNGRPDGEGWRFSIGPELFGAFGGVFGGAVAAACVVAARSAAPGRVPAALDCRFLRGLTEGEARVTATVVHAGRSLSCVEVSVIDARDRLATRATLTLVAPEALRALERPGPARPGWTPHDEGRPWGTSLATIVDTLQPRIVGRDGAAVATSIRVPWDVGDESSAEAACFAADLCVGPPVGTAVAGEQVAHPNPDLSLRFAGTVTGPELVAVGTTVRAAGGIAAVQIQVWDADSIVAAGVSCSLLLPPAR